MATSTRVMGRSTVLKTMSKRNASTPGHTCPRPDRFFNVTSHLEPGDSSSGLKGQNKVSRFNSSATCNEDSLFSTQKTRRHGVFFGHLCHTRRRLRRYPSGMCYEKVDEDFCAKQFNTDNISVNNAAGCVRYEKGFTRKFYSDMFGTV